MTVLKRGNSQYWYVQFQIAGQTIIKSARTTNKKVAEQVEARLRSETHAQRYLGHKPTITLSEALTRYIQSRENTPNHRNLIGHQRTILKFLRGSKAIGELTSDELADFSRARIHAGTSGPTIQHSLNLIRCALKTAKRQGHRVADLNYPKIRMPKYRMRYLSFDEEQRLLAELNPFRDGRGLPPYERRNIELKRSMQDTNDLVVMLLDTGARYSEIANLRWQQIDLENHVIRLWRPKVQNEGMIFMTDRVEAIIVRRKQTIETDFIFTNKTGGPRGYAGQSIRKALNRAGLKDYTIHTLRHTHATRLIQNGMSVYEVQAILGHTDIKTTSRYAHLEQATVSARARDVINRLNRPLRAAEPLLISGACLLG